MTNFPTLHAIFHVINEKILPACSFIRVCLFIKQVRVAAVSITGAAPKKQQSQLQHHTASKTATARPDRVQITDPDGVENGRMRETLFHEPRTQTKWRYTTSHLMEELVSGQAKTQRNISKPTHTQPCSPTISVGTKKHSDSTTQCSRDCKQQEPRVREVA